jgi:hypothetical protein
MLQEWANHNKEKKCIINKILEQGKTMNTLGCNLPYEGKRDLSVKKIITSKPSIS